MRHPAWAGEVGGTGDSGGRDHEDGQHHAPSQGAVRPHPSRDMPGRRAGQRARLHGNEAIGSQQRRFKLVEGLRHREGR